MNRTTDFNRLNDNGLNEMQIANPAIKQRRIANPSQRTQRTPLLRQLMLLAVMLTGMAGIAKAQSVIVNGNYYLKHGTDGHSVQTAASTGFDPSTCLWYVSGSTIKTADANGEAFSGNYFLQTGSVSLGNSVNWYTAPSNGNNLRATYYNYLRRSGSSGEWQINTNNNRATLYNVTITPATLSATISGDAILTTTGNYNYTASGSYTNANYRFNGTDHYYPTGGTTTVTPSATWSIAGDGSSYVTLNSSTGTITVNSIPAGEDQTIILTCNASHNGVDANPVTKTITLQGTIPSAPTISVSGTTVTMSTDAAGTTTIRYTLDGSDPTASSTAYNGPIDVSGQTTSPVIIKAITVRNDNASSVTEQRVQLTLPAPVITADASAGTATISCANDGATIYYTTDGTTPSATNGTEYTGQLSGLSLMTTIKAIAVRDGWNDSPVASATLTLPSGVSGSTVTLFDYEPHSWNYYSDADCPIRSLNPADVKITYYGNGTGTVQTNNDDTPSTWGADATTVKVGIDANASTFVYYKTLERTDGSTATSVANATGRCAYTTIPNPFSVRPTYESDATSIYRGFYAWRVKSVSGGTIHTAATGGTQIDAGGTINAETEIYFAPSSSTGMKVEFEALWARAYVSTSGAPSNSLGVERNFYVIATSANSNITAGSYPCTYTSIYPDGTTDGTETATSVTVYKRSTFTASADSKIEYIRLYNNNNNVITAAGYNLTIGRGVTAYNGTYCAATVRGMGADGSSALDYTIRVESGSFENFYLVSSARQTYSNTISSKAILGCDYDRATGTNNLLSIAPSGSSNHKTGNNAGSGEIYGGVQMTISSASNKDNLTFDWLVKSGTFHNGQLGAASGGDESIYIGSSQSGSYMLQYIGKRRIIVEGGDMAGIAGGMNSSTSDGGDNYNNTTHVTQSANDNVVIRIKGGNIRSSVYGAAAFAGAGGGRKFVFTGGTIAGWVAGGANGTQTNGGALYGPTNLYVGGNTRVDSHGSTSVINRAVGGNVFGAGCGYGSSSNSGQIITYGTTVVVADNAYIERGVYGGGSYGYTTNTANIHIIGGTVDGKSGGVNGTNYLASITGGVFGGACQRDGGTVNITMTDGQVNGGIYGGSNATGTVSNDVTIQIDGGQVGTTSQTASIFGGGYGQPTRVNGNVSVTLGTCTAGDATVYGDVYGGSALGTVNDASSDKTTVSLYNGTIRGGIYGGGYGPGGVAANVNGAVEVKVFGGSVLCSESDPQGEAGSGSVFGCNNAGGAPLSTVKVDIYKTDAAPGEGQYALHAVYGGGNKADYSGTPVVTIHGCNSSIEYVYGGGNASDVEGTNVTIWGGTIGNAFGGGNGYSITGNHTNQSADHYNPGANITTEGTHLTIHGGNIGAAFGGSNQYGTITGGVYVTVSADEESNDGRPACVDAYEQCDMNIGELYGGGNEAALVSSHGPDVYIGAGDIHVDLDCSAKVGMLFGGAKAADYVGDINLVVDGGTYTKVFGGNNKGGTITGDVTVTFNGGSAGEVYGGCNESGSITGDITVNIDSTNSTCPTRFYVENVYGGGNLAAYGGSPEVNIINGTVQENVYGGGYGSTAEVAGSPAVTVGVSNTEKRALVLGNVFGGGNAAPVSGDTNVKILYNSYIKGNVYGGGNKATVSGDTKVNIGN